MPPHVNSGQIPMTATPVAVGVGAGDVEEVTATGALGADPGKTLLCSETGLAWVCNSPPAGISLDVQH